MAMLVIFNHCLPVSLPATPQPRSLRALRLSQSPQLRFPGNSFGRRTRGLSVVTRAGPSTGSYVFAFLFPLSLLIGTVITALRIGDKLDREYLEELAINQAIMEASEDEASEDEEGDSDEDIDSLLEEKTTVRTRNRPKREA